MMERHAQVERTVLGTLLAENYLIADSGVKPDYFMSHMHKNIFGCMQALLAKSRPVDYVTLLTMMEPAALGGANYVVELTNVARPTKFMIMLRCCEKAGKTARKTKFLFRRKKMIGKLRRFKKPLMR